VAAVTLVDLSLDSDSPTVQLRAAHTKNGRDDEIPLHPVLAEKLKSWLQTRKLGLKQPIFDLRTQKGDLRKTSKMIKKDLAVAKKLWVEDEPLHACCEVGEVAGHLQAPCDHWSAKVGRGAEGAFGGVRFWPPWCPFWTSFRDIRWRRQGACWH